MRIFSANTILLVLLYHVVPMISVPFGRSNICQTQAARKGCHMFSCVDRQHSCSGTKGYSRSSGNHLCHHANGVTKISEKGKQWMKDTVECLKKKALASVTSSKFSCSTYTYDVDNAFLECARHENICYILQKDRKALSTVMGRRYWFDVIAVGASCPRNVVRKYISWNMRRIYSRN